MFFGLLYTKKEVTALSINHITKNEALRNEIQKLKGQLEEAESDLKMCEEKLHDYGV